MGAGASAQLDPAALSNAESLANKRAECKGDGDGLKGLVAEVQSENELLVDYIARRDALTAHNACAGIGTDERALTRVVCGRTKKHLQAVDAHHREARDGKELFKLIKGECSGPLSKMLCWRSMELKEFRAAMMDAAMDGIGTNEKLLVETLCPCTNDELNELREYYQDTRDKSLMDRVSGETSGELKKFLQKVLSAERDEGEDVDEGAAEEAVEALYKAGAGNWWGTDEASFVDLICGANRKQCEAIATAYENSKGKSLSSAIDSEFGSDTALGLNCMLDQGKVDTLAKQLRRSMKGMGTDEASICRVLAGAGDFKTCRAVAARFFELEDRSLEDALTSELGGLFEGNFKEACIAMVSDPPPHEPTKGMQEKIEELPDMEEEDTDALTARLDLLVETNEALKEHVAFQDAHEIWKACNGGWTGIGTDENTLITVMGNRTKAQLDRVDMQYRELFEKPLADEIKGETSGNFKDLLLLMQMGTAEADAYLLKKATDGWGTDEGALVDVLGPASPERLREMRDMFEARYDQSLMDLVDSETSGFFEGDFNAVLKALLARSENVDPDAEVDEGAAAEASTALMTAMSGLGTDEQAVIDILCKANTAQIAAIRVQFENDHGNSLESWLEGDFSGNAQDALLALCCSPIDFYCKKLRGAMDGLGTDEDTITRLLGSLNKSDIGLLKGRFCEKYDTDLDERLKSEVSGSWGKTVLTWVSGVDPTLGSEEDAEAKQSALDALDGEEEGDDEESGAEPELEEEPEDEGEEDEDDTEEDERKRKKNALQKKKRKEQAKKRKQAEAKKKEQLEASVRRAREKRLMKEASEEFGKTIHVNMNVEFDGGLYCLQNNLGEKSDRAAWNNFKKKGFWKGNLLRFRTDDGVFIGAIDLHRLLADNDVSLPHGNDKPYTVEHRAKKIVDERPDTLPVSFVVPVCMSGRIKDDLFKERNSDLQAYWKKAKMSKLNCSLMTREYPEIDEEFDGNPYNWLKSHMKGDIILNSGRRGTVNWNWYQKTFKKNKSPRKAKQFFKKKDWKKEPKLTIQNDKKMSVWGYYKEIGYEQGRSIVLTNKLGNFEGAFCASGYAQFHEVDEEDAWDDFCSHRDEDRHAPIALANLEAITLFPPEVEVPDSDEEGGEDSDDSDDQECEYEDSDEEEDSEEESE